MGSPVNINSLHEVKRWIEERKESGQFKRCVHLTIKQRIVGEWNLIKKEQFLPWCNRTSFQWAMNTYGDREAERDILARWLHEEPIQCPANCAFYQNERWAAWKQRITAVWKSRRHLLAPFQWFAKLPMLTQVLIVILLIVTLARPWIPQIVTMLRPAWALKNWRNTNIRRRTCAAK